MYTYNATVVRVVDGDTVDIVIDLGFSISTKQRVRLSGINAPEKSTPEGMASKGYLAEKLPPGTKASIDSAKPGGGDKYGRYLAYIWLDGRCVNTAMASEGFAKVWDGQGAKPV